MSAVTQPRMNGRQVVRCECGLIQFKSRLGLCVKLACRKPYLEPGPQKPQPVEPAPVRRVVDNPAYPIGATLPAMMVWLRTSEGLSQREMALKMGVPRTYISKIERRHIMPILGNFQRMCFALDISMENFLYLCEHLDEQAA
jgi:DNA-binding XRE family transcriptional regulator